MKEKIERESGRFYEAPVIEVTEIIIEQNILQALSGNTDSLKDIPGEYW